MCTLYKHEREYRFDEHLWAQRTVLIALIHGTRAGARRDSRKRECESALISNAYLGAHVPTGSGGLRAAGHLCNREKKSGYQLRHYVYTCTWRKHIRGCYILFFFLFLPMYGSRCLQDKFPNANLRYRFNLIYFISVF